MSKLKQQYASYQAKYKLPKYEDLNREFDIDADELSYPLRHIRKRMVETVDSYAKVLEDLMHPESGITTLYECKILDDSGKERVFMLYKKMMRLLRHSLAVSLLSSEKDDAAFIKDAYAEWLDIKKAYLPLALELEATWANDTDIHEQLSYFG